MRSGSEPAVVDDGEVERIAERIRKHADFIKTTPEERAEAAYRMALGYAQANRTTAAWAEELARLVRRRVLWAKPSN